jgi:hypothetical protein
MAAKLGCPILLGLRRISGGAWAGLCVFMGMQVNTQKKLQIFHIK